MARILIGSFTNKMWGSIAVALPFAFQGLQGGIGSWFRANNTIDSTNGHSWCGYEYQDSSPVFAPDLTQMTNGTNAVYPNAGWYVACKQYCKFITYRNIPHQETLE